MANGRLNKAVAGYHILMILSAVDFRLNVKQDMVIRDYLVNEFPFHVSLDREIAVISALHPKEWESHFRLMADDFYDDATPEERNKFLEFALTLTKADDIITKEENKYLNILFEGWNEELRD